MTTIIVVVIVALVFFVTLCVATFMVWKREEEMRTDSLRAIEANLQELGYRMTENFDRGPRRSISYAPPIQQVSGRVPAARTADPFDWTREDVQPEPMQVDDADLYESIARSTASAQPEVEPAQLEPVAEEEQPMDAQALLDEIAQATQLGNDAWEPSYDEDELEEFGAPEDAGALDEMGAPEEPGAYDEYEMPEMSADDYGNISSLEQLMNDNFEVDIDNIEVPEIMGGYIADYSADDIPQPRAPMGRDIGRSGRKYTAEELDMLIKE